EASPPSIRATSATRSSPATRPALARVRPPRTLLATRTCWCARAAIGARCVTQRTCRPAPTAASFSPTTDAARPPIPASTSSNTMVGARSYPERTTCSASMLRASSPPEAMRASGRTGSPGLPGKRNSTRSAPRGPHSASAASITATSNLARSSPSRRSSASTAGPRLLALRPRRLHQLDGRPERRVEAAEVRQDPCRALQPGGRGGGVVLQQRADLVQPGREALGVLEPAPFRAQLLLLARAQPRGVQLRHLEAQEVLALRAVASGAAAALEVLPRLAVLGEERGEALAQRLGIGEPVQQLELAHRLEQALVLVLAVDLDERVAEALEQADRHRRVVDERAVTAAAR